MSIQSSDNRIFNQESAPWCPCNPCTLLEIIQSPFDMFKRILAQPEARNEENRSIRNIEYQEIKPSRTSNKVRHLIEESPKKQKNSKRKFYSEDQIKLYERWQKYFQARRFSPGPY